MKTKLAVSNEISAMLKKKKKDRPYHLSPEKGDERHKLPSHILLLGAANQNMCLRANVYAC